MLNISLLFKKFANFTDKNSRILRIKNAESSGYCFYMNMNVWGDFLICISVPLTSKSATAVDTNRIKSSCKLGLTLRGGSHSN